MGWAYLEEALKYNRADADAVRDEMTRRQSGSSAAIQVVDYASLFRDRTSRREAVDFAAQLTDSLAAGLESSGLNIKVFRPNDDDQACSRTFALVGDVLQNTESNSLRRMQRRQNIVPANKTR